MSQVSGKKKEPVARHTEGFVGGEKGRRQGRHEILPCNIAMMVGGTFAGSLWRNRQRPHCIRGRTIACRSRIEPGLPLYCSLLGDDHSRSDGSLR
jgi:hypothetical protein